MNGGKKRKAKDEAQGTGQKAAKRARARARRPCRTCTITSLTIAVSPADRARTRIGVGEEVTLTVAPAPATWAITSGSGTLNPNTGSHTSVTFTAGDTAGNVTITATGSGCSCTITFMVVRPLNWTMRRRRRTNLRHTHNVPGCGWLGTMYLHPNNVNFYRLETREVDSQYVGTGSYSSATGDWHGGFPLPDRVSIWFGITTHTSARGSEVNMEDNIDTGDGPIASTGSAPPFIPGSGYFPIVWQWRVLGSATVHNHRAVRQEDEIFATGRVESRKGGHTEFTRWDDPTSTP